MKFAFEIKSVEDARKVRAMLMRGYHAFQAERLEHARERDIRPLGSSAPDDVEAEVTRIFVEAGDRLAEEEKAWKEMLVSFERQA